MISTDEGKVRAMETHNNPLDAGPDTTGLLEEYRPAWEIEPRWEIRMEDGRWQRVTASFEYTSIDPAKANQTVLWLQDVSECRVWSDDLIMTRFS
jgi:hypothetical protein